MQGAHTADWEGDIAWGSDVEQLPLIQAAETEADDVTDSAGGAAGSRMQEAGITAEPWRLPDAVSVEAFRGSGQGSRQGVEATPADGVHAQMLRLERLAVGSGSAAAAAAAAEGTAAGRDAASGEAADGGPQQAPRAPLLHDRAQQVRKWARSDIEAVCLLYTIQRISQVTLELKHRIVVCLVKAPCAGGAHSTLWSATSCRCSSGVPAPLPLPTGRPMCSGTAANRRGGRGCCST